MKKLGIEKTGENAEKREIESVIFILYFWRKLAKFL